VVKVAVAHDVLLFDFTTACYKPMEIRGLRGRRLHRLCLLRMTLPTNFALRTEPLDLNVRCYLGRKDSSTLY
jgi:hypothetical protein